ncbi:unnamed protein product [Ectocarpus sp. 6 AP-2014]
MWHLRKNFFIVLRSPILACTSGLGITVRYTVTMYGLVVGRNLEILNLIGFPALWIAEIALILTALRLFVMYYPSTRAKYGRVTREKPWACGLVATYLLVETVVWLAAAMQGTKRVAVVMTNLGPLSAFITLMAVACLGRQLKRIHDLSNMGRDIRLIGIILLICLPVFMAIRVLLGSILAFKYFFVIFMTISHPPIVWILNIRPVQEVLNHAPRNSIPKGVQMLLALSSRRRGEQFNYRRRGSYLGCYTEPEPTQPRVLRRFEPARRHHELPPAPGGVRRVLPEIALRRVFPVSPGCFGVQGRDRRRSR